MASHTLQLTSIPFEAIKNGTKTIESRLYDEKRQQITLGDKLTFTNREDANQTIDATVIGLHRYSTFHDLFIHNDPLKFGGPSVEWLEDQINELCSGESQQKLGVLGVEFVLNKRS